MKTSKKERQASGTCMLQKFKNKPLEDKAPSSKHAKSVKKQVRFFSAVNANTTIVAVAHGAQLQIMQEMSNCKKDQCGPANKHFLFFATRARSCAPPQKRKHIM